MPTDDNRMFDGLSMLIVDDDPEIVSALETALSQTGAVITVARDGEAAIEQAKSIEPDVVLLDAMLPKRSGFLVLEKLKPRKKKGEKPYVVMITGNQGNRHQTWAQSLGVDGYLNKPFRMEKLFSTLEKLFPKP